MHSEIHPSDGTAQRQSTRGHRIPGHNDIVPRRTYLVREMRHRMHSRGSHQRHNVESIVEVALEVTRVAMEVAGAELKVEGGTAGAAMDVAAKEGGGKVVV